MVSGHGKHRLHGMYLISREPSGGMGAYTNEIFGIRSAFGEYADGSAAV